MSEQLQWGKRPARGRLRHTYVPADPFCEVWHTEFSERDGNWERIQHSGTLKTLHSLHRAQCHGIRLRKVIDGGLGQPWPATVWEFHRPFESVTWHEVLTLAHFSVKRQGVQGARYNEQTYFQTLRRELERVLEYTQAECEAELAFMGLQR